MKRMTLEDIHAVDLELLRHLDVFCKEHKITYWLSDGTLLGAIRHNGFIPWDDDADISMPRPDYERFVREYSDNDEYKLYSPLKGNCYLTYSRLCEMKRTYFNGVTRWTEDETGVGLDIFPVNGGPDTAEEFDKILACNKKLRERILSLRFALMPVVQTFRHDLRGRIKDCVHYAIKLFKHYCFPRVFLRLALCKQTLVHRAYEFETSKNCYSLMVTMSRVKFWPKSWFSGTIDHDFEGFRFPIPVGFDQYLKLQYGDYMTPPDNKTGHSDYQTMWWRD